MNIFALNTMPIAATGALAVGDQNQVEHNG